MKIRIDFFFIVNLWMVAWGKFQNTDEILNLRALKFSPANKIYIFQCMVSFEIPHTERYDFNTTSKF